MTPKTAGYSHTYQIGTDFKKIWYEVELGAKDDGRQALYHCFNTVENFFHESRVAAEKQLPVRSVESSHPIIDEEFLAVKKTIMDFTTKAGAQAFLDSNHEWKYNIELKNLINQKTK